MMATTGTTTQEASEAPVEARCIISIEAAGVSFGAAVSLNTVLLPASGLETHKSVSAAHYPDRFQNMYLKMSGQ